MPLKLYNTLGRELQEFRPIEAGKAGFYGCGPTVYNYAHIGNLRAFVFQDVLARALGWLGYEVTHVMNVTDVGHLQGDNDYGEDRMVKSAREKGKTIWEIAEFYTAAFLSDMDGLNIRRPKVLCKATDHVPEMIALIERIQARGFAYQAGGNLYFDVSKLPDYGKLALLKLDDQRAGARTGVDGNKRNPADFALWFTKSKFEGQAMLWDSPWGRGYPGWHIECSAMSMKYLGEQFDIHSGGIDHIPVHHTNEIAQSEAATGKKWVNYWLHNEFLLLSGAKMAKSSGNFITLSSLIDEGFHPMDYRYFLLGAHYRAQQTFTKEALESARTARRALRQRVQKLKAEAKSVPDRPHGKAEDYLVAFRAHVEDDLNTPRALAELWGLLKDPQAMGEDVLAAVREMDSVLGLALAEGAPEGDPLEDGLKAEIEALIAERIAAKRAKDFARADAIRDGLKARGIVLEDGPGGTSYRLGSGL
jgi:cysteinyl-tRNA synthetase